MVADALEQSAFLADSEDLHREALAIRAEHGLWLHCQRSLEAFSNGDDPLQQASERARQDMGCRMDHG